MTISSTQVQAMQRLIDANLQMSVRDFITKKFPDAVEGLSEESVYDIAGHCIKKARANHLKDGFGILNFTGFMFDYSPNFYEHPKIRKAFSRPDLSDKGKFSMIRETMNESDWQKVVDAYDEDYWTY